MVRECPCAGSSPRVRGTRSIVLDRVDPNRIIPAGAGHTTSIMLCSLARTDHPRGCGAHVQSSSSAPRRAGSSPRVRGTLIEVAGVGGVARIIPAGAGHTFHAQSAHRARADHPRGCGAHVGWRKPIIRRPGSSPRVRGTPITRKLPLVSRRIIPAGAGHTRLRGSANSMWADHPRGCGAHEASSACLRVRYGSSPRVRGTHVLILFVWPQGRIIPAGAGHTAECGCHSGDGLDHPRGCGAHSSPSMRSQRPSGSSPRVRGTRPFGCPSRPCARIIPAGAGHTARSALAGMHITDHPRGCGAHVTIDFSANDLNGSSPRVRGTRFPGKWSSPPVRIIPAGAGHTGSDWARRTQCADHPRGCGAHVIKGRASPLPVGSSPRVRGTQTQWLSAFCVPRIIPAGAGHTRT